MGYTHYFRIEKPLAKEKFKKFGADVCKIIKEASKRKIYLANAMGDVGTTPIIKADLVAFNGMDFSNTGGEDFSYESFFIPQKNKNDFHFCKTARRPYDIVVVAVLIAFKKHFPSVKLSSDGENKDWKEGKELCQTVLGYGENYNIDTDEFEEGEILTKEEVIEKLINSELDTIRQEVLQDRTEYLESLVKNGIVGFVNYSISELEIEYKQAFDENIRIKG